MEGKKEFGFRHLEVKVLAGHTNENVNIAREWCFSGSSGERQGGWKGSLRVRCFSLLTKYQKIFVIHTFELQHVISLKPESLGHLPP